MKNRFLNYFTFLFWAVPTTLSATVTLPRIFGDQMVLQRRQSIPVWGWAAPGEQVTVNFTGKTQSTVADATGNWLVTFPPLEAGGPWTMEIKGVGTTLVFKNILVGEVWICSGQSNMEWTVSQSKDAEKEISSANDPLIRHFKVPHAIAASPQKDIAAGQWETCSPATVGDFTAVGYFFARQLRAKLKVPIGLINSSWGGTISETWTSRAALSAHPAFKPVLENVPTDLTAEMERLNQKFAPMIQAIKDDLPTAEEINQFPKAEYDDTAWKTMPVPGYWKDNLATFDGAIWFRHSWEMPSDGQFDVPCTLSLGAIDDQDITYINGIKVGAISAYNKKRVYKLPPGTIRPGRNVIAVRVLDTGGGGGFTGAPEEVFLSWGKLNLPLHGTWKYRVEEVINMVTTIGPNDYPTLLFNAMIHPLIPYSMQGVIWYQGESNAGRAVQYREAFPLLIRDWRQHWGQRDFPFLFVQLASFRAENGNSRNGGSSWAELREAQTMALQVPKTGMAVTTDIGETDDIHPTNKQDVGKRLALQAFEVAYGRKTTATGPAFKSMKVEKGKAILRFKHQKGGLNTGKTQKNLNGFEVAGADQQFVPAQAVIKRKKVVVTAAEVPTPVAVRYAWSDDPGTANLFNGARLPAIPFRTDNWPGKTDKEKYDVWKK
jgi:sialate O-acetylesterase